MNDNRHLLSISVNIVYKNIYLLQTVMLHFRGFCDMTTVSCINNAVFAYHIADFRNMIYWKQQYPPRL